MQKLLCLFVASLVPFVVISMLAIQGYAQSNTGRTFSYQAKIEQGNVPIADGKHVVSVRLYTAPSGGTPVYSEDQHATVTAGILNLEIGLVSPLPLVFGFDTTYYLAIAIDGGDELTPRAHITAAPLALHATIADLARGLTSDATGVVTSINELGGPIHITGDSTIAITTVSGGMVLSASPVLREAARLRDTSYHAGPGIAIAGDTIRSLYPPPAASKINSTLRFSGTAWVEDTAVQFTPSGTITAGTIALSGKASSASTISTDNPNTLVTKDFLAVAGNTKVLSDNLTLLGDGTALNSLRVNLSHANTWTVAQGFAGGMSLSGTSSPILLSGLAGSAGEVLVSQGTATPLWQNINTLVTSVPFSEVSSGTASNAALIVGSGSSLAASNGGSIAANQFIGNGSISNAVDLATLEVSGILSVANGGIGEGSITPGALLIGNGTSPLSAISLTNGQLLIGSSSGIPIASILTPGPGVIITNGAGAITISATSSTPSGTSLNSTLRWGGINWIENTSVLATSTGMVSASNLTLSGKASSASTVTADAGSTLVTKDFLTIAGNIPVITDGTSIQGDGTIANQLRINTAHSNTWSSSQSFSSGITLGGLSSPLIVQGSAGIANYVLTSQGSNATPAWQNIAGLLIAGNGVTMNSVAGIVTIGVSNPLLSGVTNNSTLRWNGTAWVENATILGNASGLLSATNLNLSGKATSTSTILGDAGSTLVTKDYLTSGNVTVETDAATLTGDGSAGNLLRINLSHPNTWSGTQLFSNGITLGVGSSFTTGGSAGILNNVLVSQGIGFAPAWQDVSTLINSIAFNKIISGTSTSQSLIIGNGASITTSGSGVIAANQFIGSGSLTSAVDLTTAEVNGVLPVANGGTGASTLLSNGVLVGHGSAPVTATSLTDGQILIGATNSAPISVALTAGAGIVITNGPGSIAISATGGFPAGSATNSTLRWSGTAWTENTTILASNTGTLTASSIVLSGKGTSASTVSGDAGTTLVTKDYLTTAGNTSVLSDGTSLIGDGTSVNSLRLNLSNSNTWSTSQTFGNGIVMSGTASPLAVRGTAGISGYVLSSQGAGQSPQWANPNTLITSMSFSSITSGTNLSAAMVVGAGASISAAGGTITANAFSGMLPIANGGTNSNALPTQGGVAYGDGTKYQFTPVGISGQVLSSQGTSAPTWIDVSTVLAGWSLNGNASTIPGTNFAGTTDNQAYEIHIFNSDAAGKGSKRVMRYEPNAISPNLIGGFNGNAVTIGAIGAVIAGGGANTLINSVTDDYGVVVGGDLNRAGDNNASTTNERYATVVGGYDNTAVGYSFIGGGEINNVTDQFSVIGGGYSNQAGNNSGTTSDHAYATVAGGEQNVASGLNASIIGGQSNTAAGSYSSVGGGSSNTSNGSYTTVSGGQSNSIAAGFSNSSVGGGQSNIITASYATVAGGFSNLVWDNYGAIGGGDGNQTGAISGSASIKQYATVGGGFSNTASGAYSIVSGGNINTASSDYSFVGGGSGNTSSGVDASLAGGLDNASSGSNASVGGGLNDTASGVNSTVSGGNHNVAGNYSSIPGGHWLTLGINSFGFNGDAAGTATQTDVSSQSGIAYFGNVAVIVGNIDGASREVRFYGPNTDYTLASGHYTALKAASVITNTSYTLPGQYPTVSGQLMVGSTAGVMSWSTGLIWNSITSRLGANTPAPNTTIDVNGDIALRASGYPALGGTNNDIAIGANSFIRISGPVAAFTITGIAGGVDGKIVVLYNSTSQPMTIAHDNAGSSGSNRIYCKGGVSLIPLGQYGVVKLIYSSADSRWIVMGTN